MGAAPPSRAPQSSPTLCPFSSPPPGRRAPPPLRQATIPPPQSLLLPHPKISSSPRRIGCHSLDSTARVPHPSLAHPALLTQEFPRVLLIPRAQGECHTALRPAQRPHPPQSDWAHPCPPQAYLPSWAPLTMAWTPGSPAGSFSEATGPPRPLGHTAQEAGTAPATVPAAAGDPSRPMLPAAAGAQEPCPDTSAGAGPGVGLGLAQQNLIRQQLPLRAEARPQRTVRSAPAP